MSFSHRDAIDGLGRVSSENPGQGLLLHSALAISIEKWNPEEGVIAKPIGLAG